MNRGFVKCEAGVYAAASTAGKIVLYLTALLLMVVLPETVQRHTLQGDGRSVLVRGLLMSASPAPLLSQCICWHRVQ